MNPCQNTDKELWRKSDDYYDDSIHVTAQGQIGINCGGNVIVKDLREWHKLVADIEDQKAEFFRTNKAFIEYHQKEFRQEVKKQQKYLDKLSQKVESLTKIIKEG